MHVSISHLSNYVYKVLVLFYYIEEIFAVFKLRSLCSGYVCILSSHTISKNYGLSVEFIEFIMCKIYICQTTFAVRQHCSLYSLVVRLSGKEEVPEEKKSC